MALEKQPVVQNAGFIGTGEFRFCEGFTTALAAVGKPFRDFSNLTTFSYQTSLESKARVMSRRGLRREEGTRPTLTRFGYQFKTDEMTRENAMYLTYGDVDPAGNYTQVVRAAVAVDLPAGMVVNRWYDLVIGGAEVRNITAVAIVLAAGSVTEDVDFVFDYLNCAIRWIGAVPGNITSISVTAPAIIATSALSLTRSLPLVTPIRRGIGRVLLYDRIQAAQDLFYDHRDFYCEVRSPGNANVDGTNYTEITIDVKVLTPSGSIRHRESY
jgi:hypothetical protein